MVLEDSNCTCTCNACIGFDCENCECEECACSDCACTKNS